MAVDQFEMDSHRATWLGFARLLRWSVAAIIIVLIGLAAFVA